MGSPLCFVLMPFGKKPAPNGREVSFDDVYENVIRPGVEAAGMEPIRADEERVGGIIHKPMFERLVMCPYAVADLTLANPNVFYELGVRHGTRPYSTVMLFADTNPLPFDVNLLRAIPYTLDTTGRPIEPQTLASALTMMLLAAKEGHTDSPVYQLVEGLPTHEIDHSKTDVFRDVVRYSEAYKSKLLAAREGESPDAIRAVEKELGPLADVETGVVIDLFLSYRALSAWDDMIRLVGEMAPPLANSVMVREQLGLALNRANKPSEAEKVLTTLIAERGASSETNGILGRIFKDRWLEATENGDDAKARGFLKKAVQTYLEGFEADWRDAYPGINAVTLMEIGDPPDERRHALVPVVRYSVERKIASKTPDYWDYATRLELACIANDESAANDALGDSLALIGAEKWMADSTVRNLRMIQAAKAKRGDLPKWLPTLVDTLMAAGTDGG